MIIMLHTKSNNGRSSKLFLNWLNITLATAQKKAKRARSEQTHTFDRIPLIDILTYSQKTISWSHLLYKYFSSSFIFSLNSIPIQSSTSAMGYRNINKYKKSLDLVHLEMTHICKKSFNFIADGHHSIREMKIH
jgi:hypothetical protein